MRDGAISEGMAIAADRKLLVACIFLAIGQFALVTSVWMLTGVLEPLARDFGTSIGTAGQVLSVFSITYALSAPFLSVAAARTDPRKLLIAMLAVFAAANIYASLTTSFRSEERRLGKGCVSTFKSRW